MGAAPAAACVRGDSGAHEGSQAREAAQRRSATEDLLHIAICMPQLRLHVHSHLARLLSDPEAEFARLR